jgi:hypothetical protein
VRGSRPFEQNTALACSIVRPPPFRNVERGQGRSVTSGLAGLTLAAAQVVVGEPGQVLAEVLSGRSHPCSRGPTKWPLISMSAVAAGAVTNITLEHVPVVAADSYRRIYAILSVRDNSRHG